MAVSGDLDVALRGLEAYVRRYQPRCEFYFGDKEERLRQKSPPYVAWFVVDAEPAEGTVPDRQPKGTYQLVDDLVVITARCAGLVQAGSAGPDIRRQQLAASMQVMLAVSLAAHSLHQGYLKDRGWRPENPDGCSDAYVTIDYTFAIRAPRLTPPLAQVQPTEAPATVELT